MPEIRLAAAPDQHDPLDDIMLDGQSLTPLKPSTHAGEIMVNGELISRSDVDALEAGLRIIEKLKAPHRQALKILDITECQIREAAGELAKGPQKTQRLAGANGAVLKVELPSDGWDQSKLIAAYEQHPEHRAICLRIGEIKVDLRAWKKEISITDPPPDRAAFIADVRAAVKPASGLPVVKIESKNVIDVVARQGEPG